MTTPHKPEPSLRLAIGGFGVIGQMVARIVDAGQVPGVKLAAVSGRDHTKAAENIVDFNVRPKIMTLSELASEADVVLECAPAAVFLDSAKPAIDQGRIFIPLSVGALLKHMDLVERARSTGARIMVPTGAILGLDAIKAISQGNVESLTLKTRKPPQGLRGAPYLVENGISIEDLTAPKKVFSGSARQAATGFPANVNVAAALALAGIGPDATMVEIWADPTITHNTHTIVAKSNSSDLNMTIENIPSIETPATGKITPLSVIAMLKDLTSPLVIGT
jgi:aspartate dehydrogenase